MTHILLISRCPPYPLHFGDRLIIWHLARELSERGYTLDLLALTQHDTDTTEIHYYQQFFRDIALFPEKARSPIMYLRRLFGSHYPQDASSAWQPNLWQTIQTKISQNKYDIVHLFGGVHVYEFAHLLKNIPTVITPYESYSLYLKRELQQKKQLGLWLNRQITRQFERWMYSPYDSTVVLSDEDKQELLGINPQLNLSVIPNGIDLEDFQLQDREREEATLLFVGNFDYPPNHDAALLIIQEIFPKVKAHIPSVNLQLVGNAPSAEMVALASESIEVTGRVPSVQDYLASATIFVCPLRVGAGIKNKVLEALAMGIPLIATPLSMEGISATDGKQVLVADIDDMSNKIISLLENPSLQKTLSEHSRPLIEAHYTWQSVATQYETLYRAIIEKQVTAR
ncbi:MAG: glycosyltransferase [Phototrophicaceae bacterium]